MPRVPALKCQAASFPACTRLEDDYDARPVMASWNIQAGTVQTWLVWSMPTPTCHYSGARCLIQAGSVKLEYVS